MFRSCEMWMCQLVYWRGALIQQQQRISRGLSEASSARRPCHPPLSLWRPESPVLRFATFLAVHCLCVCCISHTFLHSVSMRRRIMLPYSRTHQGAMHRACERRELVSVHKVYMHYMSTISRFYLL